MINQSFSKIWIPFFIILLGGILSYSSPSYAQGGISLGNPLQNGSLSSFIFQWSKVFFFILLGFLPVLLIAFGIYYLIIWGGFKLLHIENIPISKIIILILVILFFGLLLNLAMPIIYLLIPLKIYYTVFYATVFLIFVLIVFLFSKYHFQLSGRKLWQFSLYFAGISLIFTLASSGFTPKPFMEKAEEQFGPSIKSEVKPGKDIYKNEKYNFKIKYFTDISYRK